MRVTAARGYLIALLALAVALWLPRLRGPIDLRYDAGVYYILGTSLAEGRGYRILSEPGAIEAIQYPPLLSAVAALHQRALGTSDPAVVGHALRLTLCVLFAGYIAAVFALACRFLSPGYAFLVALLTALHAQTVFLSDFFGADIPYAFVTVLAVLAAGAGGRQSELAQGRRWRGLTAGALGIAAYGLRAAGIALLAAGVGESVLRRRYRQAAARAAVALAGVAAWQLYTAQVKNSAEYTAPVYAYQRAGYQFYNVDYADNMRYIDPFRPELGRITSADMADRVWANVRRMPISLGEAVSVHRGWWRGEVEKFNQKVPWPHLPLWLADVALAVLSLPVLAGFVLLTFGGHWLIVLYTLASVLLISITPWPVQFARYLVPLTPFLTLAFVCLLAWAGRRAASTPSRIWRSAWGGLVAAVALILVQQVYTLAKSFTRHHEPAVYTDATGGRHDYRLFFYDRNWRLHDEGLAWLGAHARPGEVVATSTPHWAYLKTGMPAVMPPYEADAAAAEHLMQSVPVTYLIVDNLSFLDVGRRYTRPMIDRAPERWSLVYFAADSGPRIYRRVVPAPPAASAVPATAEKYSTRALE